MNLQETIWPSTEIDPRDKRQHHFQGSAICVRGHQFSTRLEPKEPEFIPDKCTTCGKEILVKCPNCNNRIRGHKAGNGLFEFNDIPNPGFCDVCAYLFPWASRADKIYELENRLDAEDIDEDNRKIINTELEKLINPNLSEEDQHRIWARVSEKAGQALRNPAVTQLIENIASKVIVARMGL